MTLLLDTHYVFALAGSPGTLTRAELQYLHEYRGRFVVSAVSIWEVRLKWKALHKSGARKGPVSAEDVLRVLVSDDIVDFLPMTAAHAAATLGTPISHGDPFDELLLTQAQCEGIKLLTRDRNLTRHPLVERIRFA